MISSSPALTDWVATLAFSFGALLEGIDRQATTVGISRSEYLSQAATERLRRDGAVVAERDKLGSLRTAAAKVR